MGAEQMSRGSDTRRGTPVLLAALLLAASTIGCTIMFGNVRPAPPASPPAGELATLAAGMAQLATRQSLMETEQAIQSSVMSYLATRAGAPFVAGHPPTPTPHRAVTGSVEIEGGRCCIGGIAGDEVRVRVAFDARSPVGQVTEMRVRVAGAPASEEELAALPWQPFEPSHTYTWPVAINWIGLYVSVQYRDSVGGISPVYVDEISVEGFPPTPGLP